MRFRSLHCITLSLLLFSFTSLAFGQEVSLPLPIGVEKSTAPAYPTQDGRIVITEARSTVFVPPTGYLLLKPPPIANRPDFTVRTLYLLEADQLVEQRHLYPGESFGTFRVEAPSRGQTLKRVRVVALNDFSEPMELMQCQVRSWAGGPELQARMERQGEQVRVQLTKNAALSDAYVFVDETCLGKLTSRESAVNVELRGLTPGEHKVHVMAAQGNGMLLPSVSQTVTIAPRYTIQALEPPGEIRIPADNPGRTLGVNIKRTDGIEAASTLVYIAGQFIIERVRPEFVAELPLQDAPTGNVTVEVIGVGKDGFLYPSETLAVPLKNLAWEDRVLHSAEYEKITALNTRIKRLEAEAVYWYARALRSPTFVAANSYDTVRSLSVFRSNIQFPYLDSLTAPGASGEFNARAKKSVIEMAQARLSTGRFYRALKMWEWARGAFARTLREAGEETPTGQDAKAELKALDAVLKRRR